LDVPPVEPFMSVNPSDPAQLVASSQGGLRVSANAGASFVSTTPFPDTVSSRGDTSTVYDGAGRLFWVNLNDIGSSIGISIVQVNPVTGFVIAGPFSVASLPDGFSDDKPLIAANPVSHDLYVVWTRFVGAGPYSTTMLSRSTDHGATWSEHPVPVSLPDEGFTYNNSVAVAPDGDVYVAYHSQVGFTSFPGISNPDGHTGATFVARYTNDLQPRGKSIAFGAGGSDVTSNLQNFPRAQGVCACLAAGKARLRACTWGASRCTSITAVGGFIIVTGNEQSAAKSRPTDSRLSKLPPRSTLS
jgi:hypothetical protein